jgi:hypothetical protein
MGHNRTVLADNHDPFRWKWPDEATFLIQEVDTIYDLHKFGLREDTGEIYMLVDLVPTWIMVGGGGTGDSVTISDVDVSVANTISFYATVTGEYPHAVRIWLSSQSNGDVTTDPPSTALLVAPGAIAYDV